MTQAPSFQISADARLLFQLMEKAQVGQIITYQAMSTVISRPVSGAFQPLRTALRKLMRERDMVFSCVQGQGFKRLNDAEIVAKGEHHARRIRRHARRAVDEQMKADFTKLSREQQARFTAQVSVLSTVAFMAREKQIQQVASAATPECRKLPISETLKMFSSGKETGAAPTPEAATCR